MSAKTTSLPLPHLILALAVAAVWGSNFAIIKIALIHLPPLLLAALRFMLAFLPATTISPTALLVPVFGMSTSALFMSEPLPGWKLVTAALVMSGLALNLVWPRLRTFALRKVSAS